MLLDPETFALASGVERLLGPPGLKTELFSCLVETNTPVCETRGGGARRARAAAAPRARPRPPASGLAVAATGTHPFSPPEEQEIVQEPRYLEMLEERPSARRQLVCGLHVHVGMESFEQLPRRRSRRSCRGFRPCSRSPSTRPTSTAPSRACSRAAPARLLELPRSGAPPRARPARRGSGSSRTRAATTRGSGGTCGPHPRLGTLEVRIADQPTSVRRAAALAALVQALCVAAAAPAAPLDRDALPRAACRCGARRGADGRAARARRAGRAGARLVGARRGAARAAGGAAPARGRRARRAEAVAADLVAPLGGLGSQACSVPRSTRSGSRPRGSAAAAARRSSSWSGSQPAPPSSSAAARGRPWRRTAPSRRRSSGFRTARGRCGPCGSGCRASATSRSPCSSGVRARALAAAGAGEATSLVLFRETTIAGTFAGLGGVEGLGRASSSARGRLPRPCTPGALRGAAAPRRRAGCRNRRGCSSSRSARPRSVAGSSSATSSRRPTTRSRTPR